MMKRFVLLTASCLLLATPALAEELPWSTANTISASGAVMLAAGDLDNDSDIDIVAVDEAGSLLWVHLNDGDGTSWTSTSTAVTSPSGVALADHANDGDLDIVVGSSSAALVQLWENPGSGSGWVISNWSANSWGGGDADFIDMDGDGGPDLLVNATGSGNTYITGFGPAAEIYQSFIVGGGPGIGTSVDGGDIDGDGDTDSIVVSTDSVTVVTNTGYDFSTSTFPWGGYLVATLDSARDGELADVDGNGWLDVVVSAQDGTGDTLVWYANTAGTVSGTAQTILGSAGGADRLSTVDLDRDGDIDVLLSAGTDGDVLFLENTGDGATWTTRTVNGSMSGATHSIAADLDEDGDLDVISAGSGSVVWHENQRVHNTVSFPTAVTTSPDASFTQPSSVRFFDLDRDGDLDTIHAQGSGRSSWLENVNGDGSFWTFSLIDGSMSNPGEATALDLDGDGDLDAAVANTVNNSLKWYENTDGAASFGGSQHLDGGLGSPRAITVGDMDGDGDEDIVMPSFSNDAIYWWATPGFARTTIYSGTNPRFDGAKKVRVGDIDLDGDMDVVAVANGSKEVCWFRNDGAGASFTRIQIDSDPNASPGAIALADMDGDGDLDVLRSAASNHQTMPGLYWFENINPTNPGWSGFEIDDSLNIEWMDVADLDNDGDLDVSARSDSTIRAVINNGTSWTTSTLVSNWGDYATAADVNGDGLPDIGAVDESDGEFKWWASTPQQTSVTGSALSPACTGGTPGCVEETTSEAVLSIGA